MDFTGDVYVITAPDIAANFASRGWSSIRRIWETCRNSSLAPSTFDLPELQLRAMDIWIQAATGGFRSGIRIWVAAIAHGSHTGIAYPLVDKIQNTGHGVSWRGKEPIMAGIVWRIPKGGVIAGDIVNLTLEYERGKG
jgi:hypothetical protein